PRLDCPVPSKAPCLLAIAPWPGAKYPSPPMLRLHNFGDVPQDMSQAFLLIDGLEFIRVVALTAITDHHPGVVAGNDFPYFFVAMSRPDLIHRFPSGVEAHQKSRLAAHLPAGVIGVHEGSLLHCRAEFLVLSSHL